MLDGRELPRSKKQRARVGISLLHQTREQAGDAIRAHWGIESMHWILDVSMGEDTCQIYRENAAENLANADRFRDLNNPEIV